MKFHKIHSVSARHRNSGFALVVTITLMVLLSILALGMLSLSSVTLRTGSHDQAMNQARANARMALQLAIGQLQSELGPDQRISAPATLLEDPAMPHDSKKFWTGTYESWAVTATTRPSPVFRKWLVSQDPATSAARSLAEAEPGSDSVPVYSDGVEQVLVPKIVAPGGTGSGALAWWTSDDNQKASLLPPPDDTEPGADLRALAMSGGNGGFPLIETNGSATPRPKPFEDVDPAAYREGSAPTFGQTALLVGADSSSTKGAFPHLTTNAAGLLTNVRSGGFRKDLSVFFGNPISEMPETGLYKGDGSEGGSFNVGQADPGKDGITWRELWAFHNLPTRVSRGVAASFTTGGSPPSSQAFIESRVDDEILKDPMFRYPWPSYVRYQALLSLYSEAIGDPADEMYQMYYVIDPIITVWNPLDIAISYAGVYNTVKYWHIPYEFVFTDGAEANPRKSSLASSIGNLNQANYVNMTIGKADKLILRPGEVVVLSQDSGDEPVSASFNSTVNGKKSWNLGGGIKYRAKIGNPGSEIPFKLKKGEVFNYDINPNDQRAVASGSSYALTMNDFWIYNTGPASSSNRSIYGGGVKIDGGKTGKNDGLKATDFPGIFDKIPDEDTLTLRPEACEEKQPVLLFNYILKNETDETLNTPTGGNYAPAKYLSRLNPKAYNYNFEYLSPSEIESYPWEIQVRPLTAGYESIVDASKSGAGFFGPGVDAATGASQVITHSVPREHPISLAAYQHSIANGLHIGAEDGSFSSGQILFPGISHAIGNSLAPSVIPMGQTESAIRDNNGDFDTSTPLADHSYLANAVLWDDWFLSGISPQTYEGFTTKRDQNAVATEFFNGEGQLPIQRYKPSLGSRESADLVSEILDADPLENSNLAVTPEFAPELSLPAAHIRVNGMFNVNSTSVEAWKAVLASLRDLPAPAQDSSGGNIAVEKTDSTPLSFLITPRGLEIDASKLGDSAEQNQWVGHRMLADEEIGSLAEAIVEQVKQRGPFLSLADFVNRRVGSNADLAVSGAIQAALDDADAKVNEEQIQNRGVTVEPSARPGLEFPKAENGAAAYGSSGVVKQADILTPMAPWISVRSDSFTIRAYGESKSSSGEISQAWCEATVERSPEFVDPSQPRTTLSDDLNPTNQTFGRRFLITSFRWMNPTEIQ